MKIIPTLRINADADPDGIVRQLLSARNITDTAEYLTPRSPWERSLGDFGFGREISSAIELIRNARERKKPIVVYTDYDADGVTGGAILWETLHKLGCTAFPYVPQRAAEGYGFSRTGIDNILTQYNPGLIISVDHGIAAAEQVAFLRSKGIPVIITDHHTKQETLPEAHAIFHIPQLSGAGVAYYFAKELWQALSPRDTVLETLFQTDYCMLAAIGSVADLVPLTGATRALVKHGLTIFESTTRVGIRQMLKEASIDGRPLNPYDVGFILAPRINAIGRLGHALDALRLMCTTNPNRAARLTQKLSQTNDDRRKLVDKAVQEAVAMVEKSAFPTPPPMLIVRSDQWHEGIIGLIASRLCETYYRPTIVLTRAGECLKASCRSPATVHITNLLSTWKEYFLGYGGHAQAAGFTISEESYPQFIAAVRETARTLITEDQLVRTYYADAEIPLSLVSLTLAEKLKMLEPFGQGNPQPTFCSHGRLIDVKRMGKDGAHLKLFLRDKSLHQLPVEIVAFHRGDDYDSLTSSPELSVLYSLETNTWSGRTSVQGRLLHWHPA